MAERLRGDQTASGSFDSCAQFAGSAQHDAHEFTVTFLTSLDEDAKRSLAGLAGAGKPRKCKDQP